MRLAVRGAAWRGAAGGRALPDALAPRAGWGGVDVRRSRRVALLKRLLPAVGVALLLLVAIWPRLAPLWERIRLSFPVIDLRDARELQMVNPRYAGIDREGRPFVLTAAAGRQVPDRQDLMSLQRPHADLKTHGGAEIVVTSVSGIYQSQAQLLDLFGDVTVAHQNGTRFLTQTARINIAGNLAQGSDPVEGRGPSGDLKAQGFRILDQGETILFTGRSEMTLKAAKTPVAQSAPVALPAAIATAAAQAEAEARPLLSGVGTAPPARQKQALRGSPAAAKAPARAKPAAPKKSR